MIQLGSSPARRLARRLLEQQGTPPTYGPLYVENVAHSLWRWLGREGVQRCLLDPRCLSSQPPGPWQARLLNELAHPYGDESVFARLLELEPAIRQAHGQWIHGGFCSGTFSPQASLSLWPFAKNPRAIPLPLADNLRDTYWQVLRQRGFLISPRPRVVGLPTRRPTPLTSVASAFAHLAHDPLTPFPYGGLARHPPSWIEVPAGQPPARLFFSIARWLGPHPHQPGPFLRWCEQRRAEIQHLLQHRPYQVHPVHRSLALLLALQWIAAGLGGRTLALLELGSAAGLHLNFDRYGYGFQDGQRWGEAGSPLQLECPLSLPFPFQPLRLESKTGVDIRPLSGDDHDWLLAQTWSKRAQRELQQAMRIARQHPPVILRGDACECLPRLLHGYPQEETVVVYHSHLLNQLTGPQQQQIEQAVRARPHTIHASLEWEDGILPVLRIDGQRLAAYSKDKVYWLTPDAGLADGRD